MKKTLAAFAVLGALTAAPAAFAAELDPVPAVAKAAFVAPAPEAASSAELTQVHTVAAEPEQDRTAGGAYTAPLIYIVVVLAIIAAL
jgi:hypothetical protein